MVYTIYQMPINSRKKFREYGESHTFDIGDYVPVWTDELDDDGEGDYSLLEELFYTFNCNHPSGFAGHSLSVSDVISIDERIYFCDSVGWKRVG